MPLLLQIIQFIHQLLMFLLGVGHGVEAVDVLLRLAVHLVELLVLVDGGPRRDLQDHRHLGVGEDCCVDVVQRIVSYYY